MEIVSMKKMLLIVLSIALGSTSVFASDLNTYKVVITNLTKGQPLTPPVIVVHNREFGLFRTGQPSTPGLQVLAKDGATKPLIEELELSEGVKYINEGTGITLPGKSITIEISGRKKDQLSLVGMLARTNDAIVAARWISLNLKKGQKKIVSLVVYDAGAEENNESCDYIPAPPCNNAFADTENNEGFVHFHPALHFQGDLEPLRDAFGFVGAKVVVQRID